MESCQVQPEVDFRPSKLNLVKRVVQYIWQHNHGLDKLIYLYRGITYQCKKRFNKQVISCNLVNGLKFFIFPESPICSALMYCRRPDSLEITSIRAHLDNHTIFLDIGANVGLYSVSVADIAQNVYAFEPDPNTANMAKMNMLLNQIGEEYVQCLAVGNQDGVAKFSQAPAGCPTSTVLDSSSNDNSICVPIVRLDTWASRQSFDANAQFVMKIDVEGHELAVIEGALTFLQQFQVKAIVFECFMQDALNKIATCLIPLGYKIDKIDHYNYIAKKD